MIKIRSRREEFPVRESKCVGLLIMFVNKKFNLINYTYRNKDRVIVNRVRLYQNRSTVQGQTITGKWMNTMMTDTFDVETDFARQFDLHRFYQ